VRAPLPHKWIYILNRLIILLVCKTMAICLTSPNWTVSLRWLAGLPKMGMVKDVQEISTSPAGASSFRAGRTAVDRIDPSCNRRGRSVISDFSPQPPARQLENQSLSGPDLGLLIHLGAFDA
jgi:hypothetical protein